MKKQLLLVTLMLVSTSQFPARAVAADLRAFLAENVVGGNPECATPPTQNEVNTGQLGYHDRYYSAKEAFRLGIPVAGLGGSKDYLVIVRDYKRSKSCLSTDGKFMVEYGQVIRTVIELLSVDVKLTANISVLAAEGTIDRRAQYFYLSKDGLYNPKIDAVIAQVSGKVFDVENYGLYQGAMPEMIKLMSDPETQLSVNRLSAIPLGIDDATSSAPFRAVALTQLAAGKSCEAAKQRFATNALASAQVEAVYLAVTSGCSISVPDPQQKLQAGQILSGIKAK